MVKIYYDKNGTKQFVVHTNCLDTDAFLLELAEALPKALKNNGSDPAGTTLGILQNAMPIAYKLSGYKAENVYEQRTLVCGQAAADKSEVVGVGGKE